MTAASTGTSSTGNEPLQPLSGWGRYPVVEGRQRLSEDLETASQGACLSRGLGRSYGDASLPPSGGHTVLATELADRIISFDEATGLLRAEAGFTLAELNRVFHPRGWASPVSPGTQYVTLGGMVASDVHGKNHHVAGCFGEYVRALRMRLADGRVLEVTERDEPELLRATIGGMGLTGHILEVVVQLERIPSAWVWRESEQVADLDALLAQLRADSRSWPFTMSWVDSLSGGRRMGRGVVMRGRWATAEEAPAQPPAMRARLTVPFDLPGWVLGTLERAPVQLHLLSRSRTRRPPWHRSSAVVLLSSRRHPVLEPPLRQARVHAVSVRVADRRTTGSACRDLFGVLSRRGGGSFLSVIKDCGAEGKGMLSFPRPGISVALDLPMQGPRTQTLVDELNEIVIAAGGRIYLAKDALTRPEHLRAMEPRLPGWNAVRKRWDPDGKLRSALSTVCSGTRNESCVPRRHRRHRPGARARDGGARRAPLLARA